jgi:nicotinate-nucleotide--dimethylbenzimidazole phosphoribosyltransferase
MSLLEHTVVKIQPQDQQARSEALTRLQQLTMPSWALGRLMDLAMDMAGITGSMKPPAEQKVIVIMAGDHGVVAEGVSKYPQEVTCQMVRNFINGGAGINAIARTTRSKVVVVDLGVAGDLSDLVESGLVLSKRIGPGTRNIAQGPAMNREEAIRSIEAGIQVAFDLADSTDVFGTGEMGIGNTTPSSAITASFTRHSAAEVTGRGTGLDDTSFRHKISVIERSLQINQSHQGDPVDLLAKLGGFEIGGIAGLILGAASLRKPVVIDGFISTAGALIANGINPLAGDYMIAAHRSVEPGHLAALEHLGKIPLLDLDLRLGEGTGAALAMTLVEASCRILTEVSTFEEASVSSADK